MNGKINGKLLITGVTCFALGFLTDKIFTANTEQTNTPLPVSQTPQDKVPQIYLPQAAVTNQLQPSSLASSTPTVTASTNKSSPNNSSVSRITAQASSAATTNTEPSSTQSTSGNTGKVKFTQRTEVSDESIDQLVPQPFNGSVKRLEPGLKTKYANYLLTENQSDSDRQAENFLNDALNHGQLAGIADVNLIACKADLCELRLFEQTASQTLPTISKQLVPYADYLQATSISTTSNGQQTSIHYLINLKH